MSVVYGGAVGGQGRTDNGCDVLADGNYRVGNSRILISLSAANAMVAVIVTALPEQWKPRIHMPSDRLSGCDGRSDNYVMFPGDKAITSCQC